MGLIKIFFDIRLNFRINQQVYSMILELMKHYEVKKVSDIIRICIIRQYNVVFGSEVVVKADQDIKKKNGDRVLS